MKITYVCTVPSGGPVAHLRTLAPAVAAAGVDVQVLCAGEEVAALFRADGIAAVPAGIRHKGDLGSAARAWPLLEGSDVVHTHDRRAGLLVRPPARARGAKVVHTYHGLPEELAIQVGRAGSVEWPGLGRARRAWLRYGFLGIEALLARIGTTLVPSRAMARYLVRHGLPAERVRVIPSGIDVRRSAPGLPHDPFVVGTAALLHHHKGIDVLLAACARVARPLRVEIYGDGELRASLEEEASGLGLDAVFHGRVDGVRERLEQLDAFVLPSRGENFPIALLEAMAAALPVVATRVGGVPELVEEGVSGLLVEPDDPRALAEAIERLAAEPTLRESLGRGGARRVAERFEAADVGRRVVSLYEELCRARA